VSRADVATKTLVVVPVKDFASAKSRLHAALSDVDRELFARHCASRVVGAARPLPVLVVTDSADVVAWARSLDIDVLRQTRPGLNGAVADGHDEARRRGCTRLVVAHADLPRARSFDDVVSRRADVIIVTDHHGTGTNVLVIGTDHPFTFAFGTDSRARHAAEAARLGLHSESVHHEELSFDVDDADDYARIVDGDAAPRTGEKK